MMLLAGCSADSYEAHEEPETGELHITTSIIGYDIADGSGMTRTDIGGDRFTTGDRIKLKVICPYTNREQQAESTWGNTFDSFWLMKWDGSNWAQITSADKVDVAADYEYATASSILGRTEAQNTPYVYTASTWSENVLFVANGSLYSQYSYIFQADQRIMANYLKSDLLWAQTYMQTGSWNVHLAFNHVMACLKINISPLALSSSAVVTIEGMPDIDQREVVVGDYYADRSYTNHAYGYRDKCSCQKADNGRVLGVAAIDEAQRKAVVYPMEGNPGYSADKLSAGKAIASTGEYVALSEGGYYHLIVPPCSLATAPTIWIRDGEKRYSYQLKKDETTGMVTFEQGKLYLLTITAPTAEDPTDDGGDTTPTDPTDPTEEP